MSAPMAEETELHVSRREDGLWGVWPPGSRRAVSVHEAGGPATWWAQEHAPEFRARVVVVHEPGRGVRRVAVRPTHEP